MLFEHNMNERLTEVHRGLTVIVFFLIGTSTFADLLNKVNKKNYHSIIMKVINTHY